METKKTRVMAVKRFHLRQSVFINWINTGVSLTSSSLNNCVRWFIASITFRKQEYSFRINHVLLNILKTWFNEVWFPYHNWMQIWKHQSFRVMFRLNVLLFSMTVSFGSNWGTFYFIKQVIQQVTYNWCWNLVQNPVRTDYFKRLMLAFGSYSSMYVTKKVFVNDIITVFLSKK